VRSNESHRKILACRAEATEKTVIIIHTTTIHTTTGPTAGILCRFHMLTMPTNLGKRKQLIIMILNDFIITAEKKKARARGKCQA
jgi:hypothetical protein